MILKETDGGSTHTTYSDDTYTLPRGYTLASFTDKTDAPGTILPGICQPQGSCTFTQPPLAGTFATFNPAYSASTFVTLTDERDSNNYTVVKISNRWIMAQNLNYQKDLTWQASSGSPTKTSGGGVTGLIGHFWCPGGYSSSTATSTRASCDVWGALYSWETAMMVDGKWTSDTHASSTWSEPASYGTNTSSANTQNHGRAGSGAVTDGRGICPPNWHVPTDGEWGDVLNEMETSTSASARNHNTSAGWRGSNAGSRGKAACTAPSGVTSGSATVSDDVANWYYDANYGTDAYGFRALPSGYRNNDGSAFSLRGSYAYFWSSSARAGTSAWYRQFYYGNATVGRYTNNRSFGYLVRCIRD
jgi:uncharacterized protein (TIGR02145 family)